MTVTISRTSLAVLLAGLLALAAAGVIMLLGTATPADAAEARQATVTLRYLSTQSAGCGSISSPTTSVSGARVGSAGGFSDRDTVIKCQASFTTRIR